jgi:uncharacterized protein YndB with AHSA1/START domain
MAAPVKQSKAVTSGKTDLIAPPGTHEILITRLFDVRREPLFRALTDTSLIPQWCGGPQGPNTVVDHMDVRPGGSWRWRFVDAHGNGVGLYGVYHDVVAPERLVYTFEYEGVSGHVLLRTVTLEAQGSRTLLKEQSIFQSVEGRDGMLQSGIKEGTVASWDRLAALAANQ